MPVKISSLINDDPRIISLDEYNMGRENFQMHYYKAPGPEATNFGGQDFGVPWDDFYAAVYDFYNTNNIDPETVALRFVHCFDIAGNSLYMRMQICTMENPTFNEQGLEVFTLNTTPCAWYNLKQGSISPTVDDSLKGMDYFNTMYYENTEGSAEFVALSSEVDTFVENITFPWDAEIYQLYTDNGEPVGADIHFASTSYTEPQEFSNVDWPHGSVMYLAVGNVPFLNNDDYLVIFSNKGANDGTACPPNCGVYINPVLPQ